MSIQFGRASYCPLLAAVLGVAVGVRAPAQIAAAPQGSSAVPVQKAVSLPDAPDATPDPSLESSSSSAVSAVSRASRRRALAVLSREKLAAAVTPANDKFIQPGQVAPRSSSGDKVMIGVKDASSPYSAMGWFVSAGYSQLRNGTPNYGTDTGAFGERLGAAALGHVSEGLIGDSLLSIPLHEDARYYVMGPQHNVAHRVLYAATRTIITRTDGGRASPNFALMGGNLASAGLTNLYYPDVNRGGIQTLKTFGGSIGGSALGFVAVEFYGDVAHLLHPQRK